MTLGSVGSDIIVKIGADMSGLSSGFKQAESDAGGFESNLKSHAATLSSVGTGMTAAVTVPLVAIGAFAVKSAMTVDSAFSTMAKSTGLQGTQLTSLEGSWKSVYASVPVSADTLTSVIDKLNNSLHLQGPAMTEAATSMVNYAKVTGTDAASDTDTFTKALSGANMGLAAIHAPLMTIPQLTDMMTVGFQKTGVSISDIAPAFDKGTAAMSAMGMTVPAQIALLDGMTQSGLKARQIVPILTAVGPAAKAAGESSSDFWNHMVTDAKEGGKYTEAESTLLGKNATMFTAAGVAGKLSNDQLTASIANSTGATAKAAEAAQTLSEKFELLKQKATLAFAPIGEALIAMAMQLMNLFMPLLNVIGDLASKFGDIPAPLQDILLIVGLIVAGIGPLLMLTSKVLTTFDSMKKTLGDLSNMVGPLVQKLTGITLPGQTAPKSSLPSIASSACPDPACFDKVLQKTNDEKAALGDVKGAASDITPAVEDTGDAVEDVGSHAGILGGIFDNLPGPLSSIAGMIPGIGSGLGEAGVAAEGVAGGVAGGAESGGLMAAAMGLIGPALVPVLAILAPIVAFFGVLYATSQTFRTSVGALVSQFMGLVGWVKELVGDLTSMNFGKLGSDLTSGFSSGFNIIKQDIMGFPAMMVTAIGESVTTIGGIADKVGGMLSNAFNSIKNIDWGGMVNGLLTAIDNVLTGLLNFDPTSMINNLINGIGAAFDSLFGGGGGSATSPTGTKVSGGMSKGLSAGVAKAGPDILGKLGDVFIKLLELVPTIFSKIAIALFTALSKVDWGQVFGKLGGALAGAFGGINWGSVLGGVFKTLAASAVALGTALLNALKAVNWLQIFTLIFVTLKFFGQAIINAFKAIDWGSAFSKLGTALTTLGGNIVDGMKDIGTKVWGWLTQIPGKFIDGLSTIGDKIWGWISGLALREIQGFATIGDFIWNLIKDLPQKWINLLTTIGDFIWNLIKDLPQKWINLLTTIGDFIWSKLSPLPMQFINGLETIGSKVWSWLQGVPGQFINGLSGIGSSVWGWLSGIPGRLISGLSGIGSSVWGWLQGVPGQFISGLSGIGNSIWGWISGLPARFINGLSTIGTQIGSWIQSGISGFGAWLMTAAQGFIGGLPGAIQGAVSGLGAWLMTGAQGFFGGIPGAFEAALGQVSFDTHIPGIGVVHLAEGGYFPGRPGGYYANIGEEGDELVLPRKYFGSVDPSVLAAFGVSSVGPVSTPTGVNLPVGSVNTSAATSSQPQTVHNHKWYVSVDSENITRKIFKSIQDLEDYNHIGAI
jgi:phage-related minor tail protein